MKIYNYGGDDYIKRAEKCRKTILKTLKETHCVIQCMTYLGGSGEEAGWTIIPEIWYKKK